MGCGTFAKEDAMTLHTCTATQTTCTINPVPLCAACQEEFQEKFHKSVERSGQVPSDDAPPSDVITLFDPDGKIDPRITGARGAWWTR